MATYSAKNSAALIFRLLFEVLPRLFLVLVFHGLDLHTPSLPTEWDLRSKLTITLVRHFARSKNIQPISRLQAFSQVERNLDKNVRVIKDVFPKSLDRDGSDEVRDSVLKATHSFSEQRSYGNLQAPSTEDVSIEWTWHSTLRKQSNLSRIEEFQSLISSTNPVILYFHGGGYIQGDPCSHRPFTGSLSKESGGPVCSVRYRLAPQTAFPGQLVDAFHAYLSLLYPVDGALHDPISAGRIVLAGDSAGGNLAFSLLQLLLQLHRLQPHINAPRLGFHSKDVHISLPAGVAALSGWFDISSSLPSIQHNIDFDYLEFNDSTYQIKFAPEAGIWPSAPPRGDTFCDLSLFTHPLVSPMLAESWTLSTGNSVPMWLSTGEEMLYDEIALLATRAAREGVGVCFEMYEKMPHCFQYVFMHLEAAERSKRSLGGWVRRCVEGAGAVGSRGAVAGVDGLKEKEVDLRELEVVGFERARELVKRKQDERVADFERRNDVAAGKKES